MVRAADAQGVDVFRVGGDEFELRVDQKVFDEPFQAFAGLMDDMAHLGNFGGFEFRGVGGENFAVGQNAVERRAQFVRQHQADVVAQMGELAFGFVAHGLGLLQARVHGGVKRVGGEGFRQVIIGAQFHAVPHTRVVGQPGHQDERDGGRGRFGAQRGQGQITVHLFHVHVAQDEVGQFLARLFDAIRAIDGFNDFKALLLQRQVNHLPQPFLIIYDQDFLHRICLK